MRRRSSFSWCVALALVLAGVVADAVLAQQTTGAVRGVVRDPQGAVVPGATIELLNVETGVTLTRTTGAEGLYAFTLVQPGTYVLTVTAEGFRPVALTEIRVEVNRTTTVDVALETGTVEERVDVVASVPRIDTSSAQVSTNVERREIEALPSFNRSVLALVELAPGVEFQEGDTAGGQVLNITGVGASVSGNRSGRNGFYLDGVDNTGAFRNQGLNFPNPDTVQEIQISTSNTAAEFGRQPGGNFNVVTKSGTNQLRGTASHFFRNKALNANTWANNRNGAPKPDDKRRFSAVSLGGPVRRDHTFFFGSFMAFRDNSTGQQNNTRFPTEAMARGDFSAVPVQLLHPDTGQPLPGNIIPPELLDPVALRLVELMPRVDAYDQRFFWSFERPQKNNEVLVKLDDRTWGRHGLQFTYFTTWGREEDPTPGGRPSATNNIPAWGPQLNKARQQTMAFRHTWTIGSSVLLDTRLSAARLDADRTNANIGQNLADFGASPYPIHQEGARRYLPHLTIANGPNARNGFLSRFDQGNYQAVSSLAWTTGRHNVKAGVEIQRQNVRQYDDTERIYFLFDGRFSAGLDTAPQQNQFAYAFADFMMGRISPAAAYSASGILDYDVSTWNVFGYVQDEWRVSSRVTITPGLRYEIYLHPQERNDKMVAFKLGHQSTRFPNAPMNFAFAGDQGLDGFFRQDRNNFAPRLGVAWDVNGDGRTAVRAGLGWYYSYNQSQFYIWAAEQNPWRPEVFGSGGRLHNPWLTSQSPVYTTPPTPLTNENIANFPWTPPYTAIGYAEDFATPYSVQWNVTLERELVGGLSASAAYVGNRGHKFTQLLPINWAEYREGANDSAGNINSRRPIPDFAHVGQISSTARLWYDALQVGATFRRPTVIARLTYVLAKGYDTADADPTGTGNQQTANPLNPEGERAENQRRHTFRAFFAWDLPFFRDGSGWIPALIGGWQLSGSILARTGRPLNVTLGRDWNFDGVPGDRPDLVGEITYPRLDLGDGQLLWFDPSAFALPGGGVDHNVFGTAPRNAIFGPGEWNVDAALIKAFRVSGERRLELRFEAYNLFNHANLADPVTNFQSADFGRILARRGGSLGNRRVQLGVKVHF